MVKAISGRMTICSLLITGGLALSASAPQIASAQSSINVGGIIRSINGSNKEIQKDLDNILEECDDQFAREKILKEEQDRRAPKLKELNVSKDALNARLAVIAEDEKKAVALLSALDAVIQTIDTQLKTSQKVSDQEKVLQGAIDAAKVQRELDAAALTKVERDLQRWYSSGTNYLDLLSALLAKSEGRSLSAVQERVFREWREFEAKRVVLSDAILKSESRIAEATLVLTNVRQGRLKTIDQLKADRAAKLTQRPQLIALVRSVQLEVARLNGDVLRVTAEIASLSSITIPVINPVCAKLKRAS